MDGLLLTEENSVYDHLENMRVEEIIAHINDEDARVHEAVRMVLPDVAALVTKVVEIFNEGGRLFYIGAGTSGRLGIVDASECPPTFGVAHGMVIGVIAGGDTAIRKSVEGAEDNAIMGYADLNEHSVNEKDIVIGISASGRTPYVLNALRMCRERNIATGCIVCNRSSTIADFADFPVAVLVGPEFVTGSTRMKAGTAQKMVLNMISTAAMIKIGRVEGNKMVHMKLSNAKLVQRGIKIIVEKTGLTVAESEALLNKHDYSIADALHEFRNKR